MIIIIFGVVGISWRIIMCLVYVEGCADAVSYKHANQIRAVRIW